jgi:uncharacterized protein (TIGR04562 family)
VGSENFKFDADLLSSMAGGRSAIDSSRLNIKSLSDAHAFIKSYGYDLSEPSDIEKIWYFHRRALVLLTERLGYSLTEIPEILRDSKLLQNPGQLLVFASSSDMILQKWSCAILRCMHVYVHSESDLFSSFAQEIQAQIISPLQNAIVNDGSQHKIYLKAGLDLQDSIELYKFEIKPFKTSTSTVIKLLARPDALAMKIFDKVGVRFVTKNIFDAFRVIRFLNAESLMSFPHIMPDQSSNNLFPVELFLKACDILQTKNMPSEQIDQYLLDLLKDNQHHHFFRKPNEQSSSDFRFIKFITRKLIHIPQNNKETFSFFYPYEVQIMDQKSYEQIMSGPTEHEEYKKRQIFAARERVMKAQ